MKERKSWLRPARCGHFVEHVGLRAGRGQVKWLVEANRGWNRLADQLVEGVDADDLQHGLLFLRVGPQVSGNKGVGTLEQ